MLLRRLARPLFASWFVTEGLDAVRHPDTHAQVVRDGLDGLRGTLPRSVRTAGPAARLLSDDLGDGEVRTLARAHGAAMVAAGAMLAVGRAPRTAALALAGLTLPIVLVNLPFGRKGLTPAERTARTERFVRALSFTGGAVIAGIDLEGRPGVSWRVQHARDDRAALKAARAQEAAKHVDG